MIIAKKEEKTTTMTEMGGFDTDVVMKMVRTGVRCKCRDDTKGHKAKS